MSFAEYSVQDTVVVDYANMLAHSTYLYLILQLVDGKLSLEKAELNPFATTEKEQKALYENFLAQLPSDECRYIAYDFPIALNRAKVIFIKWRPEGASFRSKMEYAGASTDVDLTLKGYYQSIHADVKSDISWSVVRGIFRISN